MILLVSITKTHTRARITDEGTSEFRGDGETT